MSILRNKRILVTGGAGFIGSALVKRLVNENATVDVIDNLWRGKLDNLLDSNGMSCINLKKNFYHVDLTDHNQCVQYIKDYDYVFHLADIVGGIQFAFSNELFIFRQNITIDTNVVSACITNGIGNYIYVGTACSYPKYLQMNKGITALKEDQVYPAEPESSYGWSKLMGEYGADLALKSGRINVGILRFHNVYGPGVEFEGNTAQVLPSLMRKAIRFPQEDFIVWGSGNQYRDFVYIDDIVEGLILVAQHGMNKGAIQIGSEKSVTIKKSAEMIVKISGKPIKPVFDIQRPEGDYGRIAICEKARNILNWEPKIDHHEGFKLTYNWIQQKIREGHK
ncbi:NAD-dependent epimerase/dehydratase family protein [Geotalea uraniireducens]|uniref:NAD-dependent epimerase/dehydratase n=1 Tax=Geotalea uraniireducens (strain Rf4) TaxID=351605 RepID=A5GEL7_GEOUR|nr:NAD-dependent epimerase/dehydratase family protein [Geotalea uraniireducens]ABQ25872.1 NAD-dependent epimerase/dehydratase [Geotalea uraniireducens Rf4]